MAALLAVTLRLAMLPVLPVPEPRTHDEFGYLLGADTFAHGRLTNPPHPMWEHLETMHVNMLPTYQMKYPPAQSVALAFGQVAFGTPWAGVLLTGAAMAAALCWMLLVWLPPNWAFGATLAATVKMGILGYWMNSYWGGCIAAAAGALVVGSIARMTREAKLVHGAALGVGAILLANTRPFEGAVFCLIALVICFVKIPRRALFRMAVPAAAVLVAGGAAMAVYNYRGTGHPGRMPYVEHQRQYGGSPFLMTQSDFQAPVYRHEALTRFWEWDRSYYIAARDNPGFSLLSLVAEAMPFFVSVPMIPALLWGAWKHPKIAALLSLFLAILCLERWLQAHYLAPATCLIVLLVAAGFRDMDRRLAIALLIAAAGFKAWTWKPRYFTGYDVAFVEQRRQILAQLERTQGKDLVLVRYSPKHSIFDEWVFNAADIDGSGVVWAREMNPEQDREIVAHFKDRTAWVLDADAIPARLIPYPVGSTISSR